MHMLVLGFHRHTSESLSHSPHAAPLSLSRHWSGPLSSLRHCRASLRHRRSSLRHRRSSPLSHSRRSSLSLSPLVCPSLFPPSPSRLPLSPAILPPSPTILPQSPPCLQSLFRFGLIEDQSSEALKVDFANKYLGGGALEVDFANKWIHRGCVQVKNVRC